MFPVSTNCKGVNRAEISGPARKYFVRPGMALPEINILQNLYNGLNVLRGAKLMKILLSTGLICDLISEQSQTC